LEKKYGRLKESPRSKQKGENKRLIENLDLGTGVPTGTQNRRKTRALIIFKRRSQVANKINSKEVVGEKDWGRKIKQERRQETEEESKH